MIYLPDLFNKMYPEVLLKNIDGLHKISSGCAMAAVEAFIYCPIERCKVILMTQ
jgi:hypothetical protein